MAALYLFENNTATRVMLAASVLLPALFCGLAAIAARHVSIRVSARPRARKGERFEAEVRVRCPIPFAGIAVTLKCLNRLTGEAGERVIRTESGAEKCLCCELNVAHCGVMELKADCSLSDLFGLFQWKPPARASACVLIPPELFATEITLADNGGAAEEGASLQARPGIDPGETIAIREYRPGDSVRHIHWKLSQKTDTVMLRETGAPASGSVLLVFDAADAGVQASPDTMDAMAEVFLSLSNALIHMEVAHTACWRRAGSDTPELRRIESQASLAEMQDAFLGDAPSGEPLILPDFAGERFAHAVLIRPSFLADEAVESVARRVTVIARGDGNAGGERTVAFSVPIDQSKISRLAL